MSGVNEEDFASFLNQDINEKYLTPTPSKKSRYDDIQLSVDTTKDTTANRSQILLPLEDEEEIPEDIEDIEGDFSSEDLLQSDYAQFANHENGQKASDQHTNRRNSPPANTPSSATPLTPRKESLLPVNIQEFKKNLKSFNQEHSFSKHNSNVMAKYEKAALYIQRWWRHIKRGEREKVHH